MEFYLVEKKITKFVVPDEDVEDYKKELGDGWTSDPILHEDDYEYMTAWAVAKEHFVEGHFKYAATIEEAKDFFKKENVDV